MTGTLPLGDSRTIADRLSATGARFDRNDQDFDLLRAPLNFTDLTPALDSASVDLTLLAPTDAAFIRLARDLGYRGDTERGAFDTIIDGLTTLGGGNPLGLLSGILLYHVLPEAKDRAQIEAAFTLPTLLPGATLSPFGNRLRDGDPDAVDARLVGASEILSNGTLQAIDRVLLPIDVPGNDAMLPAPPTIAGIVAASGAGFDRNGADFDILLRAVQTAGLTSALADPDASLTVFAPTDAAFIQLARDVGYAGSDEAGAFDAIAGALTALSPTGDPLPLLTDILLYHVVGGGGLSRAQADAAGPLTTLSRETIEVQGQRIIDLDPDAANARFVPGSTDIEAANGVVHAVDRVLLPLDLAIPGAGIPRSIADALATSGKGFDGNRQDFDILNAALDAAGLTELLRSASLDVTLFAPTDAAFVRLARDFGYEGRDERGAFDAIVDTLTGLGRGDPIPLLTTVLTYHVGTDSLTAAEIRAARTVDTFAGETISPLGNRLRDLDPTLPDARLIAGRSDLETGNGFIQAIDRVLLPADVPEAAGGAARHGTLADLLAQSGTDLDSFGGDFDILNAALRATGLNAALDVAGASLTLLAPTDAAFIRLAQDLGADVTSEDGALDVIIETLATLGGGNPLPLLADVLRYHVLDGASSRAQLGAEGEAETLLGAELGFVGARIIDEEDDYTVRFIRGGSDVEAANGVLHAIDGVLLPLDLALI